MFAIQKPATVYLKLENPPQTLLIADERGRVFYIAKNPKSTVDFNLTKPGNYRANCRISGVKIGPIRRRLIGAKLPKFERERYRPDMDMRVETCPNVRGPALIYSETGLIKVNPKFHAMPYPFQQFILYHELGHLFYKTEWKCDVFALIMCVRKGLNPSNCFYALTDILSRSPENARRILTLAKNAEKP